MRRSNSIIDKRIEKITATAKRHSLTMSRRRKETRQSDRKTVFKPASLAYGEANATHCIVNNISTHGARITIDRNDAFPQQVTLKIDLSAISYDAQIMWCKDKEYGLRFLDEASPTASR